VTEITCRVGLNALALDSPLSRALQTKQTIEIGRECERAFESDEARRLPARSRHPTTEEPASDDSSAEREQPGERTSPSWTQRTRHRKSPAEQRSAGLAWAEGRSRSCETPGNASPCPCDHPHHNSNFKLGRRDAQPSRRARDFTERERTKCTTRTRRNATSATGA
jgi:hypothetical protein